MTANTIVELVENPIKDYVWGRQDQNSLVRKTSKNKSNVSYFAELWMGVHPNGSSLISLGSYELMDFSKYFEQKSFQPLEFIFKILSIEKCLAIQVHPNKELAEKLHSERPNIYPDSNDKPEMFCSLTEFETFYGYIDREEFDRLIKVEPFASFQLVNSAKNPREAILTILNLPEEEQMKLLEESLLKLELIHPKRYNNETKNLKIWKILEDYPHDIGIVISFFLQYFSLPPGSSIFIESGVPHAYISGECLEILKNSNNVVRLGLSAKLKDIKIANEAMSIDNGKFGEIASRTTKQNKFTTSLFEAPSGFNICLIKSDFDEPSQEVIEIEVEETPKILIVLSGEFHIFLDQHPASKIYKIGDVLLLEPKRKYKIGQSGEENGSISIAWKVYDSLLSDV